MLPNESRTDPQHGRDTHRELITFVASMSSIELERARTTWADSAKKVQQVADLIEQRLNALTGPDGWTGAGAEQFAKTIRKDLVDNLRAYALRAGGLSPQGTQEKSHANDIRQIQDAVAASIESAANNNIPWDVETKWNIKQKDVEQGILSKIDELVTGKDEEYEKAKKDAPYEVLNGSAAVVKNVPKPEFEVIDNSIPDQVSSPVYQQAKLPIDSNTQRFDKICEALSIGSAEKQQVYGKVVGVETALAAYAPATATKGQFTDTNPEVGNAGKVDGGNPDGRTSGSPAPKGTGQGETGANMPDPTKADLPGNVASPDLGGTPGTVESLPDSNDPTSPRIDLPTGTVGDAGPGSFQPSDPITGIGGGKPSTVVGAPGTAGAGA
ncbi:MAG: hypothetical protein L0G99_13030, partial [Propionibacteriales bacterium]|nr:hypothetical protein [Propionibacteriales bacterium]